MGVVTNDLGRTASFPSMRILSGVYVVLAAVAFFGILAPEHGPMRQRKLEDLKTLSDKV